MAKQPHAVRAAAGGGVYVPPSALPRPPITNPCAHALTGSGSPFFALPLAHLPTRPHITHTHTRHNCNRHVVLELCFFQQQVMPHPRSQRQPAQGEETGNGPQR